ncbi:MAG: hypothetical protein HC871_02780 [Rhizobiales bacterium]|nr:hypothetical protein [Hyphomicrobiales bacterium]
MIGHGWTNRATGHGREPDWFEVREIPGHISDDGTTGRDQAGVSLGFCHEPSGG